MIEATLTSASGTKARVAAVAAYTGAAGEGCSVRVYDVETGATIHTLSGTTLDATGFVRSIAFTPDGKYLIALIYTAPYIKLFSTSDWSEVGTYAGGYGQPRSNHLISVHPNSAEFAYSTSNNTVCVVSIPDLSNVIELQTGRVEGLAYNRSGTHLAVGKFDPGAGVVTTFNTADYSIEVSSSSYSGRVLGISYNHDDTKIVAACSSREITIFDATLGTYNSVSSIPDGNALSEDVRCFATKDGAILGFRDINMVDYALYVDVPNRQYKPGTYKGPHGFISMLSLSRDDKTLAFACGDVNRGSHGVLYVYHTTSALTFIPLFLSAGYTRPTSIAIGDI